MVGDLVAATPIAITLKTKTETLPKIRRTALWPS